MPTGGEATTQIGERPTASSDMPTSSPEKVRRPLRSEYRVHIDQRTKETFFDTVVLKELTKSALAFAQAAAKRNWSFASRAIIAPTSRTTGFADRSLPNRDTEAHQSGVIYLTQM